MRLSIDSRTRLGACSRCKGSRLSHRSRIRRARFAVSCCCCRDGHGPGDGPKPGRRRERAQPRLRIHRRSRFVRLSTDRGNVRLLLLCIGVDVRRYSRFVVASERAWYNNVARVFLCLYTVHSIGESNLRMRIFLCIYRPWLPTRSSPGSWRRGSGR